MPCAATWRAATASPGRSGGWAPRCRARPPRRAAAGSAPPPSRRPGSSPRPSSRSRRGSTRASCRRSVPGWVIVYGVMRRQVGQHLAPAPPAGACASSTLPTPVACIGSREPIVLTTGTEACRRAGRGRAPRCRRAPRGARWPAWRRRGRGGTARPAAAARSAPARAGRRPTAAGRSTYSPGGVAAQRAPGDQLADQPVRGRQRQAGPLGELGERQPPVVLVEGAEQRQRPAR